MVDTARPRADLLADIPVGVTAGTSAQDLRDVIVSIMADTGLLIGVKTTTGDPASPIEGQVYVNTSDNRVRVYADGAWRDLGAWTS